MDKKQAIRHIESIYPPDSEYPDSSAIGKEMLLEVILEFGWRNLPDDILITLARKQVLSQQ